MQIISRLRIVFLAILFISCQSRSADIIIHNAKIWTANPNHAIAEAIGIKDNRIIAIGTYLEIKEKHQASQTNVIDANGQFISPGFIDTHTHTLSAGANLSSVQLRDAKTKKEFIQRIADYAKTLKAGEWITGGIWDHQNWGGELPHHNWVDAVTPNNPLYISRLDGHMSLANQLAMDAAGVNEQSPNIEGGEMVRGTDGKLTGVFKDNAENPFWNAIPAPSAEQRDRSLKAAMDYLNSHGVSSVHHVGTFSHIGVFERARDQQALTTRIYAAPPLSQWSKLAAKIKAEGSGNDWLKIGGLKGMMDGSLGSHTALFFDPFLDSPNDKGIYVNPLDSMQKWILAADKAGLQSVIHAIGDKANSELLDIFAKVEAENPRRNRRFKIEHAQHIAEKDFQRFADLNVIASMQPYHAIDDGRWAEKYIGERINTTYAFKSLLKAGVRLSFGSDWDVAPAIPLMGIYAAVTRQTLDGANPKGWVAAEKISVEDALKAYTINGAYASFEEAKKGSLEVGKLADLVIIDQDLLTVNPDKIKDAQIVMTIVDGQIVYVK